MANAPRLTSFLGILLGATLAPAASAQRSTPDSVAVLATMQRFQGALKRGDSATALSLLAPDAMILEAGGVETRAEYRAGHLPADIRAAQGVTSEHRPVQVTVAGDVAWVVVSSETTRSVDGQPVTSAGAELTVLTRAGSTWQIRAIHWSSRRRAQ